MKIKNILSVLVLSLVALCATAEAPRGIRFQTTLRNASGQLIKSSNVGICITLQDGSGESATTIYTETHTVQTSADGVATIVIGEGISSGPRRYGDVYWNKITDAWLKVEIDPTGGSNYSLIAGESQLLSAPFALVSNESVSAAKASKIGNFSLTQVRVEAPSDVVKYLTVKIAGCPVKANSHQTAEVLAYTPTYMSVTLSEGCPSEIAGILVNGVPVKAPLQKVTAQLTAFEAPVVKPTIYDDPVAYYEVPIKKGYIDQSNVLTTSPTTGGGTANKEYYCAANIVTQNYQMWQFGDGADIIVGPFLPDQENVIEIFTNTR